MSFMSALMPGSGAPPSVIPGTTARVPLMSKARNTPMYEDTSGFGLGSQWDVLGIGKFSNDAQLKPIAQGILSQMHQQSIKPTPRYGYLR